MEQNSKIILRKKICQLTNDPEWLTHPEIVAEVQKISRLLEHPYLIHSYNTGSLSNDVGKEKS
ncbi:hypothetical protein FAE19_RS13330 [Enterococcus hirae]|uniref:hypothetical protein n=1 Tax=Enterococcus TaxID=1350 RepID=UPI0009BF3F9C|nr:hypothetical protein [Enterococcus hirae]MWO10660.1 hypothetical protein [Escherichia coli]EMF0039936.1 hypothetical protein [Enterococcus hirae]EMF0066088.1 hypothetical protein [Enterococcus hirae]EMF0071017.1 hypothetical protein [Enterococcus hirae]EMF0079066.1 hypothetical protein [Enterococcus hirae]